ncbi:hypothetical protein ADUPG1_011995 [Aduncisulcus paluster]|uniref:Uncharacterized protein n=1 Tax=Aduncisulcus paluster TaxID=2918883 RepID=A0ABQ5JXV2_9EUKA|nr:hypothetical protein ADUPG1_011995 [Aduncisulcus paluster]
MGLFSSFSLLWNDVFCESTRKKEAEFYSFSRYDIFNVRSPVFLRMLVSICIHLIIHTLSSKLTPKYFFPALSHPDSKVHKLEFLDRASESLIRLIYSIFLLYSGIQVIQLYPDTVDNIYEHAFHATLLNETSLFFARSFIILTSLVIYPNRISCHKNPRLTRYIEFFSLCYSLSALGTNMQIATVLSMTTRFGCQILIEFGLMLYYIAQFKWARFYLFLSSGLIIIALMVTVPSILTTQLVEFIAKTVKNVLDIHEYRLYGFHLVKTLFSDRMFRLCLIHMISVVILYIFDLIYSLNLLKVAMVPPKTYLHCAADERVKEEKIQQEMQKEKQKRRKERLDRFKDSVISKTSKESISESEEEKEEEKEEEREEKDIGSQFFREEHDVSTSPNPKRKRKERI